MAEESGSSGSTVETAGDENVTEESSRRNDDGLPSSFDVLIVGTGLVESIVSAAVSRNGHTVLHIDPREFYGGTWGTFTFDQWTSSSFNDTPEKAVTNVEMCMKEGVGAIKWRNPVTLFEQVWYCDNEEVKTELMKKKRRFNIDLMPKVIAAKEDIVQLLITSNVSKYLEFLRISSLLTNLPPPKENIIEPIPLSRSDIFTSKTLTLVEKRNLVKLIEAVMKPKNDEEKEQEEREQLPETFEELIKTTKVSDKIKHLVRSSITTLEDGFSPDGETFNHEFHTRCRLFLNSIGRYGNQTPFLWTLYGISEICQAFCRLSAVFGAIFILKRYLSQVKPADDGYVVNSENDEIKVKHIVIGADLDCSLPGKEKSKKEQGCITVGRAVLITKGGNIKTPPENSKSKGDGIFLYRISGMEVVEMNHTSQAVPKDYRLIQVSFPVNEQQPENSYCKALVEEKLEKFLDFSASHTQTSNLESAAAGGGGDMSNLIEANVSEASESQENSKPKVLYGSYFMLNYVSTSISCEIWKNTNEDNTSEYSILDSGVATPDLTCYVSKARQIFNSIYPDEEFLPKALDCDEQEEMNGDADVTEPENPTSNNPENPPSNNPENPPSNNPENPPSNNPENPPSNNPENPPSNNPENEDSPNANEAST